MTKRTTSSGTRSDVGPFAIIPEWLIYGRFSANAIHLYAILSRHADDTGASYPSKKRLCELMGVSEATVERAMKELAEQGAVEVEPRYRSDGGKTSNHYLIIRSDPRTDHERGEEGSPMIPPHGSPMIPQRTRAITNETQGTIDARAYEPLVGERFERQDLPWNALASRTHAEGDAYGPRMKTAIKSIRKDIVEWLAEERPDALTRAADDPLGFERGIAKTIEVVCDHLIGNSDPNLTWGPEGVARNFRRALATLGAQTSSSTGIDSIVAAAREGR